MATKKNSRAGVHKALVSFPLWLEHGLKPAVSNVAELYREIPRDLRNPVLRFVVDRAANYTVEKSVMQVVQAWELLNDELKYQKRRTLGTTSKHFRHLKRIRNKLIAHKVENHVISDRHQRWYKKTYGSFNSILALVVAVAERVAKRIAALERAGALPMMTAETQHTQPFTRADVDAMLSALKAARIY